MRVVQEGQVNTRPNFSLGPTTDKFRVVEKKRGDVWISIALSHGGTIAFPDFNVTEDGFHVVNGTFNGGEDRADITPRNVYLSPRRDYIVVEKHLSADTNVGNIYSRRGHMAEMIRPQGMRFDDACVAWYCRHRNLPYASLTRRDGYSRDIFLMSWEGDHIGVFDIAASNNYYQNFDKQPGDRSIFFRIHFDFEKERFLRARALKPWRVTRQVYFKR